MPVGDKNIAVASDRHPRRPVEVTRRITRHPRLAQLHQHFTAWTELDDLLALAILAIRVRNPDIAVRIDRDSMRKYEHAGPETGQ